MRTVRPLLPGLQTAFGLTALKRTPSLDGEQFLVKYFYKFCFLFLPCGLRFINSSLPRVFGWTHYHASVVFLSPDKSKGQRETFFEMNMHTDNHATAVSAGDAAACCPQHN